MVFILCSGFLGFLFGAITVTSQSARPIVCEDDPLPDIDKPNGIISESTHIPTAEAGLRSFEIRSPVSQAIVAGSCIFEVCVLIV